MRGGLSQGFVIVVVVAAVERPEAEEIRVYNFMRSYYQVQVKTQSILYLEF